MRRIIAFIMSFTILVATVSQNVYAKGYVPTVTADSAVLMDATTGTILYSKNMDSAYPPASTTKLMTALLTLENTNLDDVVTVGKNPPYVDGSKIYLYEGEKIKVRDLLYALFLVSANDAAETLAEYVGGGNMDNFVNVMNRRAKELGCTDTHFVNPTGLYNENHVASAKDLALIMKELLRHPEFKQIATTYSYTIAPTNKCAKPRPLHNEDKLAQTFSKYYYPGINGGKTGYTIQSEASYVASATRNGQTLIVALVHSSNPSYFPDAINLFDYGFSNYELDTLYSKGENVTNYKVNSNLTVPLVANDNFYYVKERNSSEIPKFTIPQNDLSNKSFKRGDEILEAPVTLDGKSIGTLKLASGTDHQVTKLLSSNVSSNNKKLIEAAAGFLLVLLFIISRIRKRVSNKNRPSRII